MMEFFGQWLPAVIAGGLGLVGGGVLSVGLWRKERGVDEGLSLVDLDERCQHAIALLRDLELYHKRMTPESYQEQRERLEGDAAEALRLREQRTKEMRSMKSNVKPGQPSGDEASAVVGFMARHPQLKGFVWGVGLAGLVGGLYLSVQQESRVRPPMQQAPMAPRGAGPMAGGGGAESGRMSELLTVLQEDPTNIEAMVELAHLLLRAQMLKEAQLVTERTLQLQPDHLEALTHAAVIKSGTGDAQGGFDGLDAVLQKDPTFHEAWFFRGMLSMQAGKSEQMKESFEGYLKHAPEGAKKERIKKMMAGGGIQMPPMGR